MILGFLSLAVGREQAFPSMVLRTELHQQHIPPCAGLASLQACQCALGQLRGQGVCSNTVCELRLGSIRDRPDSFYSRECSVPGSFEEKPEKTS